MGEIMSEPTRAGGHHHTEAEERRIREAALDETIEATFPASDPPSTDPNPDEDDALEERKPVPGDRKDESDR
jgi:hypothetical protein